MFSDFISCLESPADSLVLNMNRNPASSSWNAAAAPAEDENTTADHRVCVQYNGRDFWIPLSEYKRRLTEQEHARSFVQDGGVRPKRRPMWNQHQVDPVAANRPQSSTVSNTIQATASAYPERKKTVGQDLQFLNKMQSFFQNSIANQSSTPEVKETESLEKQESNLEHSYTLEDISESQETVIERPITKKQSQTSEIVSKSQTSCNVDRNVPKSSNCTLSAAQSSTASLDARKSSEVTGKLCQLKSQVVDLIDKTITQFESEQDLLSRKPLEGDSQDQKVPLGGVHPGGDGGSKLLHPDHRHRVQNMELLKTESFARRKKDIRLKLYGEIEAVAKRLKDMEFLE